MAWRVEQSNVESMIIVPAKPFSEAKTRLAPLLSPGQRVELSRQLLQRTIRVAAQISPVLVISQGAEVEQVARQAGARFLSEEQPGLNPALRQAIDWATRQGVDRILILPADLPHLSGDSLRRLIACGKEQGAGIVIAPCHQNSGTNALYLSPPHIIQPSFGPNSLQAHRQEAQSKGVPAILFHAPELAFDLDTPQDWRRLADTRPKIYKKLSDK